MANAYKTALLGKLGVEEPEEQPEPGMDLGAMSGTGGFAGERTGGTMSGSLTSGKPPVLDQPIAAPTSTPPVDAPAPSPSVFQSQNATTRGYLDEAMRAFAPTVKGIKDEAGRKTAIEGYLQSLMPEIQKRGGNISDIRGEKARVDGRMIDFFRDIEGAADPQYLDVTDEGPAMGGGMADPSGGGLIGGAQLDSALTGDPLAKIQQLIAQMSGSRPNFAALMQQLGGGG